MNQNSSHVLSNVVQRIKALASKPDDLRSVPGTPASYSLIVTSVLLVPLQTTNNNNKTGIVTQHIFKNPPFSHVVYIRYFSHNHVTNKCSQVQMIIREHYLIRAPTKKH